MCARGTRVSLCICICIGVVLWLNGTPNKTNSMCSTRRALSTKHTHTHTEYREKKCAKMRHNMHSRNWSTSPCVLPYAGALQTNHFLCAFIAAELSVSETINHTMIAYIRHVSHIYTRSSGVQYRNEQRRVHTTRDGDEGEEDDNEMNCLPLECVYFINDLLHENLLSSPRPSTSRVDRRVTLSFSINNNNSSDNKNSVPFFFVRDAQQPHSSDTFFIVACHSRPANSSFSPKSNSKLNLALTTERETETESDEFGHFSEEKIYKLNRMRIEKLETVNAMEW